MKKEFDIKVSIKEEMKKGLVFGLGARPPIGYILSFFGFHHEVIHMMQSTSHSTRAFIWNADGLPGFLVKMDLQEAIDTLMKNQYLSDDLLRWQTMPQDMKQLFTGECRQKM